MNQWCGVGNLAKDLKTNDSGKVAYGTLAVSSTEKGEDGKYKSRFIPLRFLGEKTVESVTKYLGKGTKIGVTGELVIENKKQDDGYQTIAYVIVRTWEFAQSKGESKGESKESKESPKEDDGFMNIPDGIDDQLPFN